jgi:rhamnosyltransferase
MEQVVVGVVPTYRPPTTVVALIAELATDISVVASDDASPCTSDTTLKELHDIRNVTVLRHDTNQGIARGLNDGLAAAIERGATWLLTVDQDSRLVDGYLDALLTEVKRREIQGARIGAIGAERILDAGGELTYPLTSSAYGPITEELIQTGTLWRVDALAEVGGFDESLGIDGVDAAACLALRALGYDIAVAEGTHIHHAIGSARTVRFLGRSVMVTGHSPERRSSMVRNRLRLFPAEFRQSPKHAFRTLRRVTVNHGLGLVSGSALKAISNLRP